VELKNALDSDSLIARFNVAPRTDGIGYLDISSIVRSLVSWQIPTANFNDGNLNSYANVKIQVGESYLEPYIYTDIQQNGDYVELVGSGATTYVAGDQINIEQNDGGVAMPNMEGLFTVVSVAGNDVTINRLWADVIYSMIGGEVTYADNRKTESLNLDSEQVEFINACLDFSTFRTYNEADYLVTNTLSTTKKLWTNANFYGIPKLYKTQDIFATVKNTIPATTFRVRVTTTDSDGNTYLYYYDADNNNDLQQIRLFGDFGTITTVGGSTLPVIKDTTLTVQVEVRSGTTQLSQSYFFDVDNRCRINDYEIMFLDRLGGWGSFAFELKDKEDVTVKRETFRKMLGEVTNTGFSYASNDVGLETYYSKLERLYTLNSNWMSEENSLYFEELISSPKTFLKINGTYFGCNVRTLNTTVEKFKNKNMVMKTIEVVLSNEQVING
jgi:hypothetical protein